MFSYNTRFLIADDFITMRKVTRKALGDLGYTNVHEVEDGQQALALLQSPKTTKEEIQFVIADIHMPRLEGPELWANLQKSQSTKNIPFLFLTAGDDNSFYLKDLKTDYSDYLVKPFTQKSFKTKLECIWNSIANSKNLKAS
jgi:two-component system chemotaxis response regulator CheY